jgi:RES domain-containing protein
LSFLNDVIYAYNLPFSMPKHFELGIEEIVNISSTTPFLVLDHPLAREIFDKINDAVKSVTPSLVGTNYFRARSTSGMKTLSEMEFYKPPRDVVKEGRYNHAGEPMLYLGNSIETCFAELRNTICFIAHINITSPLRVLDLSDTWVSHREISDVLDAITYSALISAKNDNDGWHKPEYKFSRFVADCAKAAGFDCIKYPSTRRTADSHNIVVINPALDIDKIGTVLHYFLYDGKNRNQLAIA